MRFARPATWGEALELKAAQPELRPIMGGTDVMVELNFDKSRPAGLLDLTAIDGLAGWRQDGGTVELGAGVTYSRLITELGEPLPGLAMASRTVGSPQIRNRGTVGGNLGSASPAGDAHPALLAGGARVRAESVSGAREIPIEEFFEGPKRSALRPDELIRAVLVEARTGPQRFAKVGTRNAMVIAVCSFGIALKPGDRAVGTGIGSAGPRPLRAPDAEDYAAKELDWEDRGPLDPRVAERFGHLVGAAASPIDDVRGTAAYRRHALSVLARRTLTWLWEEHRCA